MRILKRESNMRYLYAILTVLLLLTFLSTASCGYRVTLRNHCHLGTQMCDNLFGENTWDLDDRLVAAEKNIAEINKEILSLQSMTQLLISESQDKTAEIAQLQVLLQLIQNTVTNNAAFVETVTADLQAQIDSLETSIANQQTIINDMIGDISNLASQDTVVEYIYPCGDRNGIFDEVLMKTKSGKLIAYFESGSNRFLSLLTAGNYSTTDQSPRCQFTVTASNQIINAHR